MSEYNIQMNKYNALSNEYDKLYPQPMKHASTHAKDGSDPILPSSIGAYSKEETDTLLANKAPSGYGLGGRNAPVVDDDANNCTKNGWYVCKVNTPGNIWWYVLTVANYVDAVIVQKAWNFNYGKVIECMRLGWMDKSVDEGGGWQPWEYVNPPMILGVEYRTTERYLGKPVYVKVVDCGQCPASGFKDIKFDTSGVALPVRCYGNWSYSGRSTIPFETTGSDRMVVGVLGNTIRITTGGDNFSSQTCTVTVYYTKTTD